MEEREQEITRLLEAFNSLRKNKDWQTVQDLLYKRQVKNLEIQLLSESLSHKMDTNKLYKLQGGWEVAQTNDVDRVVEMLETELKAIKQQLNEPA